MTQSLNPWSVKGIDEETRKIARAKAKEAGLPIGMWIDRAILNCDNDYLPSVKEAEENVNQAQNRKEALDQGKNGGIGIERALIAHDQQLEKELRPIIFGLNELALRLVAAESLKPRVHKESLEAGGDSAPYNRLSEERLSDLKQSSETEFQVEERPLPEPPTHDFQVEERPLPEPPTHDFQVEERPLPEPPTHDFQVEVSGSTIESHGNTSDVETQDLDAVSEQSAPKRGKWWVRVIIIVFLVSGVVGLGSVIFPATSHKLAQRAGHTFLNNISSVARTFEDTIGYVEKLFTVTLLKFIGLVDDHNLPLGDKNFNEVEKKLANAMSNGDRRQDLVKENLTKQNPTVEKSDPNGPLIDVIQKKKS